MIELPESMSLARQLDDAIKDKIITAAVAGDTPHKFAFYQGDCTKYNDLLAGKIVSEVAPIGGYIEIRLDDYNIVLGEDLILNYVTASENIPMKHQLLLHFSDGSALAATIKMYGAL